VKKIICILLIIILCFSILSACIKPNTQKNTTTEGTKNAVTTSENTTESTVAEGSGLITVKQAKLTATEFLNYMKNKDVKNIINYIGVNNTYYSSEYSTKEKLKNMKPYLFFNDVELDSYKILEAVSYDTYIRVKATLNISKSGNELFPVGTSTWIIDVENLDRLNAIQLFKKANETINIISGLNIECSEGTGDAVDFCQRFSTEFKCFETLTDFKKLVPNTKDRTAINSFCNALLRFLPLSTYSEYDDRFKRIQLENLAQSVLGITGFDFKKSPNYIKAEDSLSLSFLGGNTTFCSLSSEIFDLKTKQYTIVIDYYGDEAFILKAKTVKYIVRVNTDSSLTLLSTKLLFNNDAKLAWYSD